jgi:hypothetical protein
MTTKILNHFPISKNNLPIKHSQQNKKITMATETFSHFSQSLRLSQSSLGQTTIGQMVNLLSNDVNRFDQSTIFLHYLWVGPIQTAIVTVILWTYYGPACLAGLAVLVLFVPFQGH